MVFYRFLNDCDGEGSYMSHDVHVDQKDLVKFYVCWYDYHDGRDMVFRIETHRQKRFQSITLSKDELQLVIQKRWKCAKNTHRIRVTQVRGTDDLLLIENISRKAPVHYVRISKRCFNRISRLAYAVLLDIDAISICMNHFPSPTDLVSITDATVLIRLICEIAHKLHKTFCGKRTPHHHRRKSGAKCVKKVRDMLTPELIVSILNTVGYTAHSLFVSDTLNTMERDLGHSVLDNGMHVGLGMLSHHRANIEGEAFHYQLLSTYCHIHD